LTGEPQLHETVDMVLRYQAGDDRDLTALFYANLWLDGMGKSEALWSAKMALRDGGDPPAYWAGWVLTGDPD
jgi:hypothetical protein